MKIVALCAVCLEKNMCEVMLTLTKVFTKRKLAFRAGKRERTMFGDFQISSKKVENIFQTIR